MTLEDIAKKLESKRSSIIKKGWTHADTQGDETYGLNYSKVQEVARELPLDAVLADELYASSNHDMKVLATMIDDPKSYTLDELSKRADQLYPSPFAEKFCRQVLAYTDHAVHYIDKWLDCQDCNLQAYAYITLSEIAKKSNKLSDDFFAAHLDRIARTISTEPADTREAMSAAVHSIAARNAKLHQSSAKAREAMLEYKPVKKATIAVPDAGLEQAAMSGSIA
jgi:hypothetical protein